MRHRSARRAAAIAGIGAGALLAALVLPGELPLASYPAPTHLPSAPASRTVLPSSSPPIIATPSAMPSIPPALMSSTGVPVTVLGRTADGLFTVTTPCGRTATIGGGVPIYGATVVIDPGHGGAIDTGAVENGIIERDLNMAVAGAMAADLRAQGVSVVLTRTSDYGTILPVRAELADALDARLMVSIHHNSAPAPPPTSSQPGTEVFVQASADSQRLGGLLYAAVTGALAASYDVTWYRSPDAGVLQVRQTDGQETYGMIRNPRTTTALIEMGWILDPAEAADVYSTPSYVPIAAGALAAAVERYLAGAPSTVPVGSRTFNARLALGTDQCTDPALETPAAP